MSQEAACSWAPSWQGCRVLAFLRLPCLLGLIVIAVGLLPGADIRTVAAVGGDIVYGSDGTFHDYDRQSPPGLPAEQPHFGAMRGYDRTANTPQPRSASPPVSPATKTPPKFSQTTASETFAHGPFAGRTIGDVATGLRSGSISPGELPVRSFDGAAKPLP
jgi:hypothetical protein